MYNKLNKSDRIKIKFKDNTIYVFGTENEEVLFTIDPNCIINPPIGVLDSMKSAIQQNYPKVYEMFEKNKLDNLKKTLNEGPDGILELILN